MMSINNQDENIRNAIRYLQLNTLKEILNKMSKEELLNYQYEYIFSKSKSNLLELSMSNLSGWSYSEMLSTDIIAFPDFNEENIYVTQKQKEAIKLYLVMFDYICSKVPELITEETFKKIEHYRPQPIMKILSNYYIDKNNNSDSCIICFSSHNSNLINNTCLCKNKIHLECLIEYNKKIGNMCKACNHNNGGMFDPNNRLIFPSKNIYKAPLMSDYFIANDKKSQLHFAIAYLQHIRINELLETFTKEEYLDYYKHADCYALHNKDQITGALTLKNMPYTNISRIYNGDSFSKMESILSYYHNKFTN